MLRPSPYVRQTVGGASSGKPTGFFRNPNNNVWLGAAALVVITGFVYWAGYTAEEKRLQKREAREPELEKTWVSGLIGSHKNPSKDWYSFVRFGYDNMFFFGACDDPLQNGPGKFGDPNKFKLKEQKNGLILGGLAIASVVGVLYMIRNRDVRQQGTPANNCHGTGSHSH
ncbi:hypothetical protein JOM56_000363 [Amanita muscaria]